MHAGLDCCIYCTIFTIQMHKRQTEDPANFFLNDTPSECHTVHILSAANVVQPLQSILRVLRITKLTIRIISLFLSQGSDHY